ncbi:MAG: type II toxin-antitoxin system HigB family toxin [candidate division KSB1 bacterium]|nr:type II toxin-antitoxin system HigB family toxin [candidate division KSB1 bacterium]MDZ7366427.1 type II toxin-antitoxin system HigB family toxin [candidate division KSB1 bacterium]MDZ7404611.1 type II toxin-antitoxin system HigB family toxin [candidate division KSB1 bacterium]
MADNRVIFNLKGNKYRLEGKISYKSQVVLVNRIGIHAEYSKWKF